MEISLDEDGSSRFDKCSGNRDRPCTEANWAAVTNKITIFSHLLELWGGYKTWELRMRMIRRWRREGGTFNLEIIISGLVNLYQIAFPNHCTLSMFDLHDEHMISFSWNRSSKTLEHELWLDTVDLAVWEAAGPSVYHTLAWAGAHMGVGRGQVGSSLWVMIYHLPYI